MVLHVVFWARGYVMNAFSSNLRYLCGAFPIGNNYVLWRILVNSAAWLSSGLRDEEVQNLSVELFSSFRRDDQRRKGAAYLRGLLSARGRKSIRNIAAAAGDGFTDQNLHHFISDSPWDWVPVREALTRYVASILPVQALVVRPMVIPKWGTDCIGVERSFHTSFDATLNAQHAIGVWAASHRVSAPVNWRLRLSRSWLGDEAKRRRASIPIDIGEETTTTSVLQAYLEVDGGQDVPRRPVVLDARRFDVQELAAGFNAASSPWLMRIDATQRVSTDDRRLPGLDRHRITAHRLLKALRQRHRVEWVDQGSVRTVLAASAQVTLHGESNVALSLIGTGAIGQQWPEKVWLTNLDDAQPLSALIRLGELIRRVDHDVTAIGVESGLHDFSGRPFTGWHRHITLASAAHALRASTYRDRAHFEVTAAEAAKPDLVISMLLSA